MGRAEPYDDIRDLPEEEASSLSKSQRAAFKRAWNRAAENRKDEGTALREARIAASQKSNGND